MQIILENKFKALDDALYDENKYNVIRAGRRTGKTYNTTQWLLDELLSGKAKTALWVDTTHSNIEKYVDRYYMPIIGKELWSFCHWDRQKKVLKLPNGEYIDFGSAERPELLEGFEYDRIVVNEAGLALRKKEIWNNTIQPMTKGANTKVRLIGTPKGRNQFHSLSVSEGWRDYHFTAYDSPYWDKEELDKIKATIPEISWKQEYMADFIEDNSIVFRKYRDCIQGGFEQPIAGHYYSMGVDLAKYEDFTVVTVLDNTTKHVCHFDRFNTINWTVQKQRIFDIAKRFNNATILIDSTGIGDPIYEDLQRMGLNIKGFKFTNLTKQQLIERLQVSIENRQITFPEITELINELEIFEYEMLSSGMVRYTAPDGFHDDCVISLALVNYQIENGLFTTFKSYYESELKDVSKKTPTLEEITSGRFQPIPIEIVK